MQPGDDDWTRGPGKFVAAGLLGAFAIVGMVWSLGFRTPAPPLRSFTESRSTPADPSDATPDLASGIDLLDINT
ncbi:MAG: hypothetical protein AAF747_09610, partial [Planctomycetota bacterium]